MSRKPINVSRGTTFSVLLAFGLLLLLLPQSFTSRLNFLFAKIFSPVLSAGRASPANFSPSSSTEDFIGRGEYEELWKAYENLHADLMTLHSDYEKLANFRKGLPKPGPGLVLSRVTNVAIGPFDRKLFIDKGSLDGLQSGEYVTCENRNSIIGTISELSESAATVRLLTDPRHKMEVGIWRTGKKAFIVKGQLEGSGKGLAKIPLISRDYDIRQGDIVYASAVAGRLETPRVIGEVFQIKEDDYEPLMWDITVKPITDYAMLTHVAVIITAPAKTGN